MDPLLMAQGIHTFLKCNPKFKQIVHVLASSKTATQILTFYNLTALHVQYNKQCT
jgi:hypothetical protein